jgi:hypothetical protein
MTRLRPAISLVVIIATAATLDGQAPRGQRAPTARNPLSVATLSSGTITELLSYRGVPPTGIARYASDSRQLMILSSRQLIAFGGSTAAAKGGRYDVPQNLKFDTVTIVCGSEELRTIFNCTKLAVQTDSAQPRRVAPITYTAKPQTFTNAFGASWTARIVQATYPSKPLLGGFLIDYTDDNDTTFTYVVSDEEAEKRLFLRSE